MNTEIKVVFFRAFLYTTFVHVDHLRGWFAFTAASWVQVTNDREYIHEQTNYTSEDIQQKYVA